jgi:hypothetical protein
VPNERATEWDVFVAHASQDLAAARKLSDALDGHGLRCFLDAERFRGGASWPVELKWALSRSKVIAVLVSEHSDEAYYLQEEVAIAVTLYRSAPKAVRVVPVLLEGAERSHLPYGTFRLHSLQLDEGGWPAVAESLASVVRELGDRPPGPALANATRLVDKLWSGLEPALTDRRYRVPDEYRLHYALDGEDVIAVQRAGGEQQRVTRAELERRLERDQLRHIRVLERSMEVNLAIWEERYPKRVLDKRSRRRAEEAAAALAEDLAGVLDAVEQSGLYLDDHYLDVRQVVREQERARAAPDAGTGGG